MGVNFSNPAYGADVPAAQAMPHVPRSLRKKASCATDDPTMWNSARSRASGMQFSRAFPENVTAFLLVGLVLRTAGFQRLQVSYGSPPLTIDVDDMFPFRAHTAIQQRRNEERT